MTVLLWESLDDVRAFAGDELERAVFFPEDGRYLVERDLAVTHYEDDLGRLNSRKENTKRFLSSSRTKQVEPTGGLVQASSRL